MQARLFLLSALHTLAFTLFLATPGRAQSPADPGAAVPPMRYESITAGTKSYRPVEPLPWPDVNRRVAPPGATNQGKEDASPGAKDAPPSEPAKPNSNGPGLQ
jgi:hypothetical protein